MTDRERIILGLDPGLAILGYGLIRADGPRPEYLDHGCLSTESADPLPVRLNRLFEGLRELRDRYCISDVAVETVYHATRLRAVLGIGEARGVALLAVAEPGTLFAEYTPAQVKQAVTGYGHASKRQVQEMVRVLLDMASTPTPDDAADALAVALCHERHLELARLTAHAQLIPSPPAGEG